jgi:hypothetical protein
MSEVIIDTIYTIIIIAIFSCVCFVMGMFAWIMLCTLIGWVGRKCHILMPIFISDWDLNHPPSKGEEPMVVVPPEAQLEEPNFTLSELNAAKEYIEQCKS